MNRLAFTILLLLGVVFLACVVLKQLGMDDIVKNAGDHVREKAGLSATASGPDAGGGAKTEIEKLLGLSLSEILKQPVEAQKKAEKKILAEIDRLRALQITAKGIELEADARTRENESRRRDLLAVLDQAKAAVDNPETDYPVKIGNYFYNSPDDLLDHAVDIRMEAKRLDAENAEIMNVPLSALKDARAAAKSIRELENALAELQTVPLLAGTAKLGEEVEGFRKTVRPLTSAPEQIKKGIPDPRRREDGSRAPTFKEKYQEAFEP